MCSVGVLVERTMGFSREGLRVDVSLYENGAAVLRDGGLPYLWSTTAEDVRLRCCSPMCSRRCCVFVMLCLYEADFVFFDV